MDYLGVSQSLSEKRWIGPENAVDLAAQALMQNTELPLAMCFVLARLGIPSDDVETYLDPLIKSLLPDPRGVLDMSKAAERILRAVANNDRIAVFADYDVDGASSAALLLTWLKAMGRPATLYVPDRIDEGYGPNEPAMRQLAENHELIICVDCGTLSHAPIAAARPADVIVLDHHLAAETLPDCVAVVNPNRQDETGALSHLCAAAVVFLCLVECGRLLRGKGAQSPDLMNALDLVALATVADVAPLIGVNRAFVHQGLKVMARRARPGLVALCDIAKMDSAPKPYHLGFLLGPRINAGGRVGQADLGARLLSSDDPQEADMLAARLDALNAERRQIEEEVRAQALAQAEARGFDAPLVWAAGEGWHPGVVGIVASRLKEAAGRPAVVIGIENGEGKGSGRSVSGIDLGAAIQNLAAQGVLIKGGGHKMAAGLSVAEASIETAMEKLA
ncbi:MAG: single-stranded-DNA-specific exonuclease RecJ, partial [Paracoccaceae bacterium]